jgi:hypothetical protein
LDKERKQEVLISFISHENSPTEIRPAKETHSAFTNQSILARYVNIVTLNDEEMTGHSAGNVKCGGASYVNVTVDIGPVSVANILIEPS